MKKAVKLLIVMLLSVTLLTGCDFVNDITNGITGDPYYSDYEIQQRLNEVKYHAAQLFNDVFYELQSYAEEDLNTAETNYKTKVRKLWRIYVEFRYKLWKCSTNISNINAKSTRSKRRS